MGGGDDRVVAGPDYGHPVGRHPEVAVAGLAHVPRRLGVGDARARAAFGGMDPGIREELDVCLRNKHEVLVEALAGSVGAHQRFLLGTQLRHLGDLDALIESLDAEIKERLRPAQELIERLSTIPGVGGRTAEVILVEIGQDMGRFGSSRQLASWAGMCPRNYESAGVQRGRKTRRGSPWLRTALVGSARSASRTKTYLGAQYRRLAARRGAKRAFVAVGHTILGIVCAVLTSGRPFDDLGVTYFDCRDEEHVRRRLTRRLEALGYVVTVEPSAA
jgi:transposase